jgi:hypothetical protein
MNSHPSDSSPNHRDILVMLDGLPVELPPDRQSLAGIRAYLEMLAMEQQRILCSLTVDSQPTNLADLPAGQSDFARIEAESLALDAIPLQLLKTARQQTLDTRDQVQAAVTRVLINSAVQAREFWWRLARELKEPLLTLSLLPENTCGQTNGAASLKQLRKWQLQQLAAIIRDVDAAAASPDTITLSTALENRVLPWLDKLHDLICLWDETVSAGSRLAATQQAA